MNSALLELFLSRCESGISIKEDGLERKILDEFVFEEHNDNFMIKSYELENDFIIKNLSKCKVYEHPDCIGCFEITNCSGKKIYIEEMI